MTMSTKEAGYLLRRIVDNLFRLRKGHGAAQLQCWSALLRRALQQVSKPPGQLALRTKKEGDLTVSLALLEAALAERVVVQKPTA